MSPLLVTASKVQQFVQAEPASGRRSTARLRLYFHPVTALLRVGLIQALELRVTIRDLIQGKARFLRIGFFALSVVMLAIGWLSPGPLSYLFAFAFVCCIVILGIAYQIIRCPRCEGRLWIAGMGFLAPGQTKGVGFNCPKCGVSYTEPAEL